MRRSSDLGEQDSIPGRAQLIQEYMSLHSQQTSVQRRLSASSSSTSSSPSNSPGSSPSRSPPRIASSPRRHSPTSSPVSAHPRSSRRPLIRRPSVPTITEEVDEDALRRADEAKLGTINERINSTLTELLNCESVRNDDRMRQWVHSRLMDMQQKHLDERRRRVSEDTAEQDEATSPPRRISI